MTSRNLQLLIAGVVVWIIIQLQWGTPLAWDELEFFHASRWIGLGRLPYRDFWEHHAPLQWFLFAPFARAFGAGCGVTPLVAMRWVQLGLLAGIAAVLWHLMRRSEVPASFAASALLLLGCSPAFITHAIEFRVDLPGNLLFLSGLALALIGRYATITGVLWGLSVLTNMRMAPLAVGVTILLCVLRVDQRRWQWNPRALRVVAGGALTAAAFAAFLILTGSADAFLRDVVQYNLRSDALIKSAVTGTFARVLAHPFVTADAAGILFIAAAVIGLAKRWKTWRNPDAVQIMAVIAGLAVLFQLGVGVHYPYHLQSAFLLAVPAAATGLAAVGSARWALLATAATLVVNVVMTLPGFGEKLRYQETVMCAVDTLTSANETVFDAVGYATTRRPAWDYWFVPAGVVLLAERGEIPAFDLPQFVAAKPAAVVYTLRTYSWFSRFPRLASYVRSHYVPVYRNLWVPGLSGKIDEGNESLSWFAPRAGRYRIYASEQLAGHPWFDRPFEYGLSAGEGVAGLKVSLSDLDHVAEGVTWIVDGEVLSAKTRHITVRAGSVVTVQSEKRVRPLGVMVIQDGVGEIFVAPSGSYVF